MHRHLLILGFAYMCCLHPRRECCKFQAVGLHMLPALTLQLLQGSARIQTVGMRMPAGLQQRHNQEQMGNQEQPDNTQAGRFPSVIHYDESAADSAGFLQSYSRSVCAHVHET